MRSALAILHTSANWALLLFLACTACLQFSRDWDYLSYHLPDALARFGLTTYQPAPHLQIVNEAFPPLPHLIQGLLIYVTGRMSSGNTLNILTFGIISVLLVTLLGREVQWRWFYTAILAIPLTIFHLTSGYIDLFSNLWVVLVFAALLSMQRSVQRGEQPAVRAEALLLLGVGAGMLSKLQVWPTAGLLCAYSVCLFTWWSIHGAYPIRRAFALSILLAVLFSFWPARNLYIYGNPTYPAQFPFLSSLFPNHAMPAATPWNIPQYLLDRPHSVAFIESALELNRLREPAGYHWTLDQWSRADESSPHHRMGGWFWATMSLLILGYAVALWRRLLPTSWLLALGCATVLTSAIPQSHELRYWLYIPYTLALIFAMVVPLLPRGPRALLCGAMASCCGYVISHTVSWHIDSRLPAELAPEEARAFWAERPRADQPTIVCHHMPQTIFWSGPTFNQFPVQGCDEE